MDQACPYSPLCLGMCEFYCPGQSTKNSTQRDVSAQNSTSSANDACSSRAPPCNYERFSEFIDDKELAELSKGLIPANTSKCTNWALKTFELWKNARNQRFPNDCIPEDLFHTVDPSLLNTHLTRFAVEARKANGEQYPPSSIHQLLCGLLRHMREINPLCPNFLNKKDAQFTQLHHSLDVQFNKLHSSGIGRQVKHAETISGQEENTLWEKRALGLDNPTALQNAAFFTVGKMLCLRGGIEHRGLKLSQFQRRSQPDHYVYVENVSKNRNGSFKQLHVKSKTVPIYACPEAGVKCPVNILDFYFSKLPAKAFEDDVFYVRPLKDVPSDPSAPWYSAVPIGKHTLNDKVKKMCLEAGVQGNKTNHSLRATGATRMYQSGIPEKVIQERTGHRSLEGLRSYERSSEQQHQIASASTVLSIPQTQTYHHAQHATYQRQSASITHAQPSIPGISLQNLHGCTININQAPSSLPLNDSTHVIDICEKHIDELISNTTNS